MTPLYVPLSFRYILHQVRSMLLHKDPGNPSIIPSKIRSLLHRLSTLQRYRTSGELPYEMIYHKTFYRESDVLRFIERNFSNFRKLKKDRPAGSG